ncbi:MAG: hypothetical protein ABIQ90_05230 [Polaromonas sp.]
MIDALKEAQKGEPGTRSAPQDSSRAAAPAQASLSLGYMASVLGGILGALAAFYGLLFMLHASGNLPPPAFSNSLCVDEKLSFLREQPPASPNLLVIGSSVAWRHFDGATVSQRAQGIRPLNGAFCGLHANQSVYVANWLLDRQPSVRQVLLIAAPQDFADCHKKPDAVFSRNDADDFVYGGASRWPYYLQYFSPVSLIGNARRVKDKRANRIPLDPLVFTAFGDGPLNTAASINGLGYGRPEPLDAACFQAVQSLATRLQKEGRQFIVVSSPLHPDWKAREDADGKFIADFNARLLDVVRTANTNTNTHNDNRYWNADGEWTTARASFTDAIHLRWSAVQDFSAVLATHLQPATASEVPK